MPFKALRSSIKSASGLAAAVLASAPACVGAQDLGGDARVRASLTTAAFYTDNFFYRAQKDSAAGALVRPEFKFVTETGKTSLDLTGRGEYGTFDTPGSKDDYVDSLASLRLGWTPTYRNRFILEGEFNHGHDPFGLGRTEGSPTVNTDLDEWDQSTGALRYRYGAPGAKANAEVGVSALDRKYTTNGAQTQFLEYSGTTVDYGLFYNYSPKAAATVNFSRTDIEVEMPFDNNAGPGGSDLDDRSGDLYQIRTGLRWLATAKTSGDVQAGYRRRTFDQLSTDLEGFDWQAGVQWSPTPPLSFELRTARSEQQSYEQDASVIDVKSTSLRVRRSVSARTKAELGLDETIAEFFGTGRDDTTRSVGVGVEYLALSYMFLVGNVAYQNRESNAAGRDYDRMSAFVGLRLGR